MHADRLIAMFTITWIGMVIPQLSPFFVTLLFSIADAFFTMKLCW